MTRLAPDQEWWTAEELAGSGLPDLPTSRQGIEALAKRLNWRAHPQHARKRKAKGGGWEYHWKALPSRAQVRLLKSASTASTRVQPDRDAAWGWFEALPESTKAKAAARLEIIQKVEALEAALGRDLAIGQIARIEGVSARTIWNWLALIEGVRTDDRLAYLAPRHRAAASSRSRAKDCDPEFFAWIKSDYLRLAGPSFATCYRRAVTQAKAQGWDILPERTMRRRLDTAVSGPTQVLARKGLDALKRLYPAQVRDKTSLSALEVVNADFHRFDVFVRWPAAPGEEPEIVRPQMVAFQDIHSGFILSWRVDVTPNSTAVMLAAGDMIETWGIPEHVLFDNGREFAAKAITGGAPNRYRFKVLEDDLPGLFVSLGCEIHWASPYSGQSKPIERAFRDMCDNIAKDPRFAGAWTGNRPDAKPEDYGSRAIDLEYFLKVLAEGIEEHNARQGRRSEVAWGRSFAEVFSESYANSQPRRATEAQRRLWLLGAEGLRGDTRTGQLKFMGNVYWADWMHEIAGARVIARFDPADLWSGIHVYSHDNRYLGEAPCHEKVGFFDVAEGRAHKRARTAYVTAEKKALVAHRRFRATELGAAMDALAPIDPPKPEAKVVRAIFATPDRSPSRPSAASVPMTPDEVRAQSAMMVDLTERRSQRQPEPQEAARERFRRALELERQLERREPITPEQQRWLAGYQSTAEYRGELALWKDHGDAIFG